MLWTLCAELGDLTGPRKLTLERTPGAAGQRAQLSVMLGKALK
jgi:hypothetical protein